MTMTKTVTPAHIKNAIQPFSIALSVHDAMPPELRPSDNTPLRDVLASGWLTVGDLRSLAEAAVTIPDPAPAAAAAAPACEALPTPQAAAPRRKNKDMPLMAPDPAKLYLSVKDVAQRFSISIQTVWRHTKASPSFPKPVKILNGSTRWRLNDIIAYENSRGEGER